MEDKIFAAPPTVKVGGKPYHIRYSHGALYQLSCWGIDANDLIGNINKLMQEGHYTEAMGKICAAGLGTMDADGNWTSLGLTPLQVSDKLRDGEAAELDRVAWQEFAKKYGLVMRTAETAKPASEADATQSGSGSDSTPSEPAKAA